MSTWNDVDASQYIGWDLQFGNNEGELHRGPIRQFLADATEDAITIQLHWIAKWDWIAETWRETPKSVAPELKLSMKSPQPYAHSDETLLFTSDSGHASGLLIPPSKILLTKDRLDPVPT